MKTSDKIQGYIRISPERLNDVGVLSVLLRNFRIYTAQSVLGDDVILAYGTSPAFATVTAGNPVPEYVAIFTHSESGDLQVQIQPAEICKISHTLLNKC